MVRRREPIRREPEKRERFQDFKISRFRRKMSLRTS